MRASAVQSERNGTMGFLFNVIAGTKFNKKM